MAIILTKVDKMVELSNFEI